MHGRLYGLMRRSLLMTPSLVAPWTLSPERPGPLLLEVRKLFLLREGERAPALFARILSCPACLFAAPAAPASVARNCVREPTQRLLLNTAQSDSSIAGVWLPYLHKGPLQSSRKMIQIQDAQSR